MDRMIGIGLLWMALSTLVVVILVVYAVVVIFKVCLEEVAKARRRRRDRDDLARGPLGTPKSLNR